MHCTRSQSKQILPMMLAVILAVIALGGRPLHLLEHSCPPQGSAVGACGCVHHARATNHCVPQQTADHKSSPPRNGDHDPDHCDICLTFLLQSLPDSPPPAEQVVPIEVRRILPNDRLLGGPFWIAATARGPPGH